MGAEVGERRVLGAGEEANAFWERTAGGAAFFFAFLCFFVSFFLFLFVTFLHFLFLFVSFLICLLLFASFFFLLLVCGFVFVFVLMVVFCWLSLFFVQSYICVDGNNDG